MLLRGEYESEIKRKAEEVMKIVSYNVRFKSVFSASGGIPDLVALARDGDQFSKERAACTLSNLTAPPVHPWDPDLRPALVAAGAIEALAAIPNGFTSWSVPGKGLVNLALDRTNAAAIVAADGIPKILWMLSSETEKEAEAAQAVQIIAEETDARKFLIFKGAIAELIEMVRRHTSGSAPEIHAKAALGSLTKDDDAAAALVETIVELKDDLDCWNTHDKLLRSRFKELCNEKAALKRKFKKAEEELEKKKTKLEECLQCKVCQDAKCSVILMPCMHVCLCEGCAETLRSRDGKCPMCRADFASVSKIYIA